MNILARSPNGTHLAGNSEHASVERVSRRRLLFCGTLREQKFVLKCSLSSHRLPRSGEGMKLLGSGLRAIRSALLVMHLSREARFQ